MICFKKTDYSNAVLKNRNFKMYFYGAILLKSVIKFLMF